MFTSLVGPDIAVVESSPGCFNTAGRTTTWRGLFCAVKDLESRRNVGHGLINDCSSPTCRWSWIDHWLIIGSFINYIQFFYYDYYVYLYMDIGRSILNHDRRSAIDINNQHSYMWFHEWSQITHYKRKDKKMETRMRGKIANIWFYNLPCGSKSHEIGDADWYAILSQVWNQNPSISSSSSAGMWFQPLIWTHESFWSSFHFWGWQTTSKPGS